MTRRLPLLLAALAPALLAAPALAVDEDLKKMAEDPDSFERSAAARALGKLGTPDAARLLVRLLADENPYVRDYTVLACGGVTDEAAVKVLTAALRTKEDLGRRNAAAALARTRSTLALEKLARLAAKDRSAAVRVRALDGLVCFRGDPAALAACAAALDDREPRVRAAAVEAAGRVRGEGALDLVKKGLEDPDEGVRCVAMMELGWLDPDAALAGLAGAARAEGWRTRAQAVDDALRLREAPAVDALVALVGDPSPRVAAAAHRALRALTGKDLGRDPELWRAWWAEARKGWKAPRGRLDAERPGAEEGGHGSRAAFHGVTVDSDRVVFVLDVSGSMAEEAGEGRTRWDLEGEELARTLAALPDGTLVNVLAFSERVNAAFPRLAKLGPGTRRKIASFAARTVPGDRGDLLAAMEAALAAEGADTVFLLSDGAPSAGEMVVKDRVRAAIRRKNRTAKRAIMAIGLGAEKKTERRFLAGLARDSGGRAVFR